MKVGVDFDNVINDLGPILKEKVTEHFGNEFSMKIFQHYSLRQSLGISRFEELVFWQKYGIEIASNAPPKMYCKEAMNWLKKHGFHFHVITSRPTIMKPITDSWLQKNKIPFDDITYGVKKKGEFCRGNKVKVMIEDAEHNILDLTNNKIPTIVIPYPHNQKIKHKYVVHLKNWKEIGYFLLRKKPELMAV